MWTNNTGTFTKQLFLVFKSFYYLGQVFKKIRVSGLVTKDLKIWDRFTKIVLGQVELF